MNKELIKTRFAKNIDLYNSNADIQRQMALKLISFAERKKYPDILEIGCGTGLMTQIALSNLEYSSYTANDIVEKCESRIKQINPKINFVCSDIELISGNKQSKYDLILANASLQWVENFESTIKKIISLLNPGGTLIFSTFGQENFREIRYITGKSLRYYSKKELENLLQEYSPIIEEEIRVKYFKTPYEVLKHIKYTGVNSIENVCWTKSDMQKFSNSYNNLCSGHPTLTYHPLYIKIQIA